MATTSFFHWTVSVCKFAGNIIYSRTDRKVLGWRFKQREPSRNFKTFFYDKSADHDVDTILSGYLSNKNDSSKCIQIINGVTNERPDLDNHIEEAHMRIIPYIAKTIELGLKNVVVVTNDTDVCVLLLHYTSQFVKSGLRE